MKQHEFIMVSNNIGISNTIQDDIGNTKAQLKDGITINHNYKKKDMMTISFDEENIKFLIPDRNTLERIYKMYLETGINGKSVVKKFCTENLSVRN